MERRNKNYTDATGGVVEISCIIWLVLIAMKVLDVVSMGWTIVLLGILWIPLLVTVIAVALAIVEPTFARIKHQIRVWKVDRRIKRQAKAAGVWDKQPIVLGGRALELKAKQDFKIRRQPGETDAQLRRRYMAAAAKPPKRRRIKLPHMSFEGKFSLFPPKIPKLVIRWYLKGGVAEQLVIQQLREGQKNE